jgi:hypothetical protein
VDVPLYNDTHDYSQPHIYDINFKMIVVDTLKTLAADPVVGFTPLIEAPLNQTVDA